MGLQSPVWLQLTSHLNVDAPELTTRGCRGTVRASSLVRPLIHCSAHSLEARTRGSDTLVEPVRKTRISQQIVVQLCALIREGRLRHGDRLPPEREFADQLHVSRASLREALRALELAGLVESRQGGGTYVRNVPDLGVISPLALLLQASGDSVGDLWEVRLIVEPEVAARAALRADGSDLHQLEAILEAQQANLGDEERTLQIDRTFHETLARSAHNAVLVRVVELIGSLLQRGRGHFMTSLERRRDALARHREVVDAVKLGQPGAAREAMRRHLEVVEAYILGDLVDDRTPHGSLDQATPIGRGQRF
jgi:GntR family transcriptional repressor for pyruvate dehydrogenase complex